MTRYAFEKFAQFNSASQAIIAEAKSTTSASRIRSLLGTRAGSLLNRRQNTVVTLPAPSVPPHGTPRVSTYGMEASGAQELAEALLQRALNGTATPMQDELFKLATFARNVWPRRTGLSAGLLRLRAQQLSRDSFALHLQSDAPYTLKAPATARAWRRAVDRNVNPMLTRMAQKTGDNLSRR